MYRLKILYVDLPPLRERDGDAEQLAQHFVAQLCAKYRLPPKHFDAQTLGWIRSHDWPGNVRELENWVHRELLMSDGPTIHATTADGVAPSGRDGLPEFRRAKAAAVRQFEYDYVLTVMRQSGGNVTRAAQMAGKERRAFGKLIKKHGIDRLSLVD